MRFIVMEIQIFPNGNISTPCYAYDDRTKAESKYFSILSSAAISSLPKHACALLTEDGMCIRNEAYEHEQEASNEG